MRPIASSGLRWPTNGVEVMRIFTRSPHSDFEEAHPHPPRPESSSARVKQRRNLGDGGYTLTSDRREMVTVAMRNGFAWAQRWALETSGPFTLPSALGRVSRAPRDLSAARNCTRDEGGPFEFGDQEPTATWRPRRLPSRRSMPAAPSGALPLRTSIIGSASEVRWMVVPPNSVGPSLIIHHFDP